jgi:pectate lyase
MRIFNILLSAGLALASPLSSGPGFDLGLAAWGLEGYAKDNPIGPTTGGEGGEKVYVSTADELYAAAAGNDPKIIYVKGAIELPSRLRLGSNKSLIGVGWNAEIKKSGITVNNTDNTIIRNLKISFIVDADCISINNATRVWVDHNEFESELSVEVGPDFYVCTSF